MRVVGDPKLVRDCQKQRVGLRDPLVLLELAHQTVRLGRIASPEDRARLLVDEADLVPLLAATAEIGAIAIIDQRKNAAAHRHAGFTRMTRLFPGRSEGPDRAAC